jgi:predicted DNA-binding protein YlxM (UPF0122 family)
MSPTPHLSRYQKSPLIGKKASKKTLRRYCDEISRCIALQRDENKCFYCGETKHLQVHHLITRKNLKTRFNLNNLVTLCAGCHNFRITAIHHSPWIIFEELRKQRLHQYTWFCMNRQKEKLLSTETIDYTMILKELMVIYYQYFPFEPRNNGLFTPEQEKHITYEYTSGFSLHNISQKYNTTTLTIQKLLKRHGIQIRDEGTRSLADRKVLKEKMQKVLGLVVCKIDKDNNILDEYPSIYEAAIANKLARNCVRNCIHGRTQTSGGYHWKLKKDISPNIQTTNNLSILHENSKEVPV